MSRDIICIVAGGWSASLVDLEHLPGCVIGVNESCIRVPCDIGLSMDRLWTEFRWQALEQRAKETWIRKPAAKNITPRPDWLRLFECDFKSFVFSETPDILNGTNSGFCALNLAYLLKPRRLYLLGFDMNRSPDGRAYWWGNKYEWAKMNGGTGNTRYAEWGMQFGDAARAFQDAGIMVRNVSETSAIRVFKKISPKEFAGIK